MLLSIHGGEGTRGEEGVREEGAVFGGGGGTGVLKGDSGGGDHGGGDGGEGGGDEFS